MSEGQQFGGKAFAVIGGTGRGKTTFVSKQLAKVHKNSIALYDVNREKLYKPFTAGDLPNIDNFVERTSRMRNALIVYEEATIFFSNRGHDQTLKDILVRKRHTNNTVFLVFHSLRDVPNYVYRLCNYVVLFKTNDSGGFVKSNFKDERLSALYERVRSAEDEHHFEIFDIYGR